MKTTTLVEHRLRCVRAAIAAVLSVFLIAVATIGHAQIRQTHLYIDDGNGNFTILSAPSGGGALTFPSSGTLLSSSSGLSLTPSSTQTIISQATNIHPLVIQGASGQTFDLQDWSNSTPSILLGVTAGGALNQTTVAGGSSPTTGIQFNSHTYFWGNDNPGVFVGWGSGAAMPTSSSQHDAALGTNTLNHENSGSGDNTAVGYYALESENGATGDVAIGYTAMSGLSSGDYNVAIGFNSMANNSHGGSENVAIGENSLSLGTVSANNSTVAVGAVALEHADGTSANTALGYGALNANSAGNNNTAVGFQAAANNTTANSNTAIGYEAMFYSTTSTKDVAIGYDAMFGVPGSPNTGNDNTAIGYNSLVGEKTTGADNTGVGYNSLHTITTGTENTAIGSGADVGATATERTAIGYNASSANDHNIQLGSATVTSVTTSGVITTGDATGDVGGLKITDGTNTAEITATTATNNPVFNLPAEGGTGPYTLVTSGTDVVLSPGSAQTILPTANIVPLIIKGESGQSVDLQEWQNNSGTKLAEVTAGGALDFANGMTATTGIQIGNVGTTVFWSTTDAVFAGSGAGSGNGYTGSSFNTGFGYDALNQLPSSLEGADNDAFGREALKNNTTGNSNAAFGDDALEDNVSGNGNTAVGGTALLTLGNSGGTGNANTAVGYEALESASSIYYNPAVGYFALQASSGTGNVGIGFQAGYGPSGTNKITTGANNTYLGYNASPGSSTQHNNSTAIGTYATVDEDDALVLGEISSINGASTTVKVGIGTNQPAALLSVGTSSALQVDASGNLSTSGTLTLPSATPTIIFGTSGNNRTLNFNDGDSHTLAQLIDAGDATNANFKVNGVETDFLNPDANGYISVGSIISMVGHDIVNIDHLTSTPVDGAPTGGTSSGSVSGVGFSGTSSDLAGEVTFTTTTAAAGDFVDVKYGTSYASPSTTTVVIVTPADQTTAHAFAAAGIGYFATPVSNTDFEIGFGGAVANGTYSFYYHVIGQ